MTMTCSSAQVPGQLSFENFVLLLFQNLKPMPEFYPGISNLEQSSKALFSMVFSFETLRTE